MNDAAISMFGQVFAFSFAFTVKEGGGAQKTVILKKSQLQLLDGMVGRGGRVMRREENESLKREN